MRRRLDLQSSEVNHEDVERENHKRGAQELYGKAEEPIALRGEEPEQDVSRN